MRRIGNRLQLAIARWKRVSRKLELFRTRQRWARKFDEYDCVGGPLDGHVRACKRGQVVPTEGGYYAIDNGDCRLHFHANVGLPFARDWSET